MKCKREERYKIKLDDMDVRILKSILNCFFEYHSKFPGRKEEHLEWIKEFNIMLTKE
jgi:hypothetical protein